MRVGFVNSVVADLQGNPEPVAPAFRPQLWIAADKRAIRAVRERLPMISQSSGWPMTASARPLRVAATEGLEQLLSSSGAKSFGGVSSARDHQGEGRSGPLPQISATRSAGHASRAAARFRCNSYTTEFTNPTRSSPRARGPASTSIAKRDTSSGVLRTTRRYDSPSQSARLSADES